MKSAAGGVSWEVEEILKRYAKLGWSILPLRGKTPYHAEWPIRNFTLQEVLAELKTGRADNVGIKTGKVSKLLALDVDQPHLVGFDPKPAIERYALVHTTSRSRVRLVFRATEELCRLSRKVVLQRGELSNEELGLLVGVEDKESVTVAELLGDGRQFVAPPSRHPETGEVYRWLTPLPDSPSKILCVKSLRELWRLLSLCFTKKWVVATLLPFEEKVRQGPATLPKLLAALDPYKDREYSGWITFHCPFHPPDRNASFAVSKKTGLAIDFHDGKRYTARELAERLGIPFLEKSNKSMATKCVELAIQSGRLFHDTAGDGFIHVRMSDYFATLKLRSRRFKQFLAYKVYTMNEKVPSAEDINQAVATLEAKALFESERRELAVRVKREGDVIFYDPCRPDWKLVRITNDGYTLVENAEPRFRRYAHMQTAEVQAAEQKDALKLLDFLNLPRSEQGLSDEEVLVIVIALSYLIPDIPHPILLMYGHQGSGKTLAFKILKSLLDPSATPILSKPENGREFVQQLAHNYLAFYDNVSQLSNWEADILCRAITGEGSMRRELYTDEEDVIFAFKRCVGINAINVPTARPDLMDRSVLIELPPIPPNQRRTEEEIFRDFESEKPRILGGFFATISRAIGIRPAVKLDRKPRLADFAEWGYAIAEALGIGGERFIKAYERNVASQAEEVVKASAVAEALVKFMEDKQEWAGSPSQLLEALEEVASQLKISTKARWWPKAPHVLTRRLRELRTPLLTFGLTLQTWKDERQRWIGIRKLESNASVASSAVNEKKADRDGVIAGAKAQNIKSINRDEKRINDGNDASDAISLALYHCNYGFEKKSHNERGRYIDRHSDVSKVGNLGKHRNMDQARCEVCGGPATISIIREDGEHWLCGKCVENWEGKL